MRVARQLCRNTKTTSVTSSIASASVFTTSRIDSVMNGVVSYGITQLTPLGKLLLSSFIRFSNSLAHVEGIGAGAQIHQQEGGGLAVHPGDLVVVAGAEGDRADILHPHQRSVGPGTEDDVGEFGRAE